LGIAPAVKYTETSTQPQINIHVLNL